MESVFQQLHKKGVGAVVKHASAITDEEENHIWQSGITGDHSPTDILRAVFYLNGIIFFSTRWEGTQGSEAFPS